MGSNAAENHPISFRYVNEARKKGAKLLSVDPRFTRTSSKADIYAPLRSGTDIAFVGGMIKYILDSGMIQFDYVANYTNASFIVDQSFAFHDGLFSGYDPKTRRYDKSKWAFETDADGVPKKDLTLRHKRCVYQLLKDHYSRYNTKLVSEITGTPEDLLLEIYRTYAATGASDKAGTIMYAMGWTQHTVGVQNIRAMCIVQLLLGNMGVAGGGVNALRGESNVQGSTDHCLLWHIWPGYLRTPRASNPSLADYNQKATPKTNDPLSANWWQNYPKYSVSLLKAFFGDAATPENEFGYGWLPKADDDKDYSWLTLFDEMYKGRFKGFFAWGQNPACSGANANKNRQGLAKLDWMVNVNIFDNETGSFWKEPGVEPTKIKTEVFFLPAAVSVEKEGSITNSGRWMQWRYAGPKPLGNSRPDGDIMMALGHKIKAEYQKGGVFPDPILKLKWDYETNGQYDPHKVAKQINGYFVKDVTIKDQVYKQGTLVPSFAFLQADGSTSSGNWLYCNSYTEKGNMAARRSSKDAVNNIGLYPEFSWCWPVNRRILYNRASLDLQGQPWNKQVWVIKYEGEVKDGKYVSGKWVGDVPDGGWPPMQNPDGSMRQDAKYPFIMRKEGHGQIFGPGLVDGPFPEHYEPLECPVDKNLMNGQRLNPTAAVYGSEADQWATCDPRYPYVGTTYRVVEHWQTGVMTRWQPWLLEMQPQMFVEMSEELAGLKGIKNGERVRVSSLRGVVEATAIVTKRFQPFKIGGAIVHQVGMPWHFGWVKPSSGKEKSANLLTPSTGDPNTRIPETKAFMVNVTKM
jgi:formate dehydrogenase major subunit